MKAKPICVALALSALASEAAMAADRWQEAARGAVAILPSPSEARGITGGSLYCAEQKWAFLLRADSTVAYDQPVRIGIDGRTLAIHAIETPGSLQVAVPTDLLPALKMGSRIRFAVGDDKALLAHATFSLRNSSRVIEAITPRCSPIDMSSYQAVTLSETGRAANTARRLFREEIELFRAATGKDPTLSAAEIDRTEGKRMLFGSLCGSTYYYGTSGCTLTGWAAASAAEEWKPVYATEGVRLYLDETRTHDGWPGLATLPVVAGTEITYWGWSGNAYKAEGGELMADEETGPRNGTAQ